MKKMVIALVLLFAFAPAVLADAAVEPMPAAETQVVADADGLPMSALQVALDEASVTAAAYSCPWYTTYCSRDSQCDSYCGAPGAGACENGCCACLF